jgi:ribulose kinase
MRIDHISESHPTTQQKKKAQKKERKEKNRKETSHQRNTKKIRHRLKTILEKKVKTFAVAAPQFSGQRIVKEKNEKR